VAPSLIQTDMVRAGLASSPERIPLGRFGTPEECPRAFKHGLQQPMR
jgi:3-oxoacyl-[acyl-carrier protein] reductase